MEELDPARKIELQRTVESLDRELSKWSDDLPGKDLSIGVASILTRSPSRLQVTGPERARRIDGRGSLLTLLLHCLHPAPKLSTYQQGAHPVAHLNGQGILFSSSLYCIGSVHQECGTTVAPPGFLHPEPLQLGCYHASLRHACGKLASGWSGLRGCE
jgi:hypothetical protein